MRVDRSRPFREKPEREDDQMRSCEHNASELPNGSMQPLRRCPFCGGYWEVMPIPQTYRYSAIGICAGCGAMVMTTYEHTTLASAIDELIRRINARGNPDCADN